MRNLLEIESLQGLDAIERVKLARQARQLHALNVVATALSSSIELNEVLNDAVTSLLDVTGLNSGVVYFLDGAQSLLVGRSAVGFRYGLTRGIDVHVTSSGSFPSRAFRSAQPIVFDVKDRERGYDSITEDERRCIIPEDIQTAIASRLESSDRVYGVVALCSHHAHREYTANDLDFIKVVCGQIGVAIERARLYEELKTRALESSTLYEMERILGARFELETILKSVLDLASSNFGFLSARVKLHEEIVGQSEFSSACTSVDYPLAPAAAVPLEVGGVALGSLEVVFAGEDQGHHRRLKPMADMIAMAIWNQRLYRDSKRLGVMEERNRLAREIHDGLTQKFYGIQLQLSAAAASLGIDSPAASEHLLLARRHAQDGLEEARRSVRDLRCATGEHQGLSNTIYQIATQFRCDSGVPCSVAVRGTERAATAELETAIARSVQELLHNVMKHAWATRVEVTLAFEAKRLDVVVHDDGRGLPSTLDAPAVRSRGYGLLGIRERIEAVGGEFDLDSDTGGGTTAVLSVPLSARSQVGEVN